MNAKIGREDVYKDRTGKYRLHESSNENGKIKSTSFQRKDIYKGIWMAPNRKYTNQIDHALIEKSKERAITNVRSNRGANIDSDHFLVGVHLNQPILKNMTGFNSNRKGLRIPENEEELIRYGKTLTEVLAKIEKEKNIQTKWENITQAIGKATNEITPKRGLNKKPWFDEECIKVTQKKTEARLH